MSDLPVWRVRDRPSFALLRRAGRRTRTGPLSVTWVALEEGATPVPRVAFTVSRRAGNAVARNRIRRRLRAAITRPDAVLVPGVYLVGGDAAVATMPFDDLVSSLATACAKATRTGASG